MLDHKSYIAFYGNINKNITKYNEVKYVAGNYIESLAIITNTNDVIKNGIFYWDVNIDKCKTFYIKNNSKVDISLTGFPQVVLADKRLTSIDTRMEKYGESTRGCLKIAARDQPRKLVLEKEGGEIHFSVQVIGKCNIKNKLFVHIPVNHFRREVISFEINLLNSNSG